MIQSPARKRLALSVMPLTLWVCCAAASAQDVRVQALPALADRGAWRIAEDAAAHLAFADANDWLGVKFDFAENVAARLMLAEPISVPDWATGLSFEGVTGNQDGSGWLHVLIRDARGQEFLFQTRSPGSYEQGIFMASHTHRRCRTVRFTVPGLDRVNVRPDRNGTITPPRVHLRPVKPYTILGLQFVGRSAGRGGPTRMLLRDFAFTRLTGNNSRLYYQWQDQDCYGELAPWPRVTLGEFLWWPGEYRLTWDIRDRYDGTPLLAGGRTFEVTETPGRPPLEAQLAQGVDIPVVREGTYWVRARVRRSRPNERSEHVIEREYRLYVRKGQPARLQTPLAVTDHPTNSFIRVCPERTGLLFAAGEKFAPTVYFYPPAQGLPGARCTVRVVTANLGTPVREKAIEPNWLTGGAEVVKLDLSDVPPGAYRVEAEITWGDRVYDRGSRLIGRSAPAGAPAAAAPDVPKDVPTYRQVLESNTPMFPLSALLDNAGLLAHRSRWELARDFIDQMPPRHHELELHVPWRLIEPLPGAYDTEEIAKVLDHAAQRGVRVVLFLGIRDVPEWMPSTFTQNREGDIAGGQKAYLFHGARLNLFHVEHIRQRAVAMVSEVARRFVASPGLMGYHILIEHPCEAPYAGWYEGFAPETRADWKRYCREIFPTATAADLAARWRAPDVKSLDDIRPPDANDTRRLWLDWLAFRAQRVDSFNLDLIRAIRRQDPARVIILYGDGYEIDPATLKSLGVALANGGSHDAMGVLHYSYVGLAGLQERTEDHSPGRWSGYFPTQLDASVFAMTFGGGNNTHCKAYTVPRFAQKPPDAPFSFDELRTPPYSLDRFEQFQPTWTELRTTHRVRPNVFSYQDIRAYFAAVRTNYTGWFGDGWVTTNLYAAHLQFAAAPKDVWSKAPLLLATERYLKPLEADRLDELEAFVRGGGSLVMLAETGRYLVDDPNADWVLLKRFGFIPPIGERVDNIYTKVALADDVGGGAVVLRETWNAAPQGQDAETLAYFRGDPNAAAVTWRPVGKGRVAVIWADTVVPPANSDPHGGTAALYRVLARWAGCDLLMDSPSPHLWMNLLKQDQSETYYGLAMHGISYGTRPPVAAATKWKLPAGTYEVTEVISNRSLGKWTAEKLWNEGIETTLPARAVAIYRMTKK